MSASMRCVRCRASAPNTTFVTGDARYQLSRDWGVGAVANVSRTDGGTSWSLEGYVDHLNAAGTGRAQADFAATTQGRDATLTLNQTWSTPVGMRLSTSASVERISGAVVEGLQQDSTVLGWRPTAAASSSQRWASKAMCAGRERCRDRPRRACPPMSH